MTDSVDLAGSLLNGDYVFHLSDGFFPNSASIIGNGGAETVAPSILAGNAGGIDSAGSVGGTRTQSAGAGGLVININYDSSVNSAPAGFTAAIEDVVGFYESVFSDPITVNIDVGWGEVAGQALASGALGQSATYLGVFNYAQVRAALAADVKSADDTAALAALPSDDPTGGGNFIISTAEARALGLTANTSIDGYVGFSATAPYTFDPNNRAVAGAYDFIGVAEHEISEVMGRIASLGSPLGSLSRTYTALDLFRYSSPGVRQLAAGRTAYFSVDGGGTNLNNFNTTAGGDDGDWAASAGNDSYNAFANRSVANPVTANDLRTMDAIGWDRATAKPVDSPPVVTPTNANITASRGQSFDAASLFAASDPDGDAITQYDFWDTGEGGGHFTVGGVAQPVRQDIYVSAAQLAQTAYQSGAGTDTLWVRASDGSLWSPWSSSFTVTGGAAIAAEANPAQLAGEVRGFASSGANSAQGAPIILIVGPAGRFQTISDAVSFADSDGNLANIYDIRVTPGTYVNDFPVVTRPMTIEADPGSTGAVVLSATVPLPNLKGIILNTSSLTVRGLTFQGAAISNANGGNGAGIRDQSVEGSGSSLIVENSVFTGNQEGILTGYDSTETIKIINSRFINNGNPDHSYFQHALYVNLAGSLTVTGSLFGGQLIGHDIKSRAAVTTITNNRIYDGATDPADGINAASTSYGIDVPNGGVVTISGNLIVQGATSENNGMVDYGAEGLWYGNNSFVVSNNTFISSGVAQAVGIKDPAGIPVQLSNNTFQGIAVPVSPASAAIYLTDPGNPPVNPPPINTPPVVTPTSANITANHGQSLAVASLFTASDPDGDAISQYDFWDTGTGGGHFTVDGVAQPVRQDIYVSAAQLAQTAYQSGAGTDTLWVRAYDGSLWSPWSASFTVTGAADAAPVVVPASANITATRGQSLAAAALFAASDPDGDAISQYDFWDTGTGGGYFTVGGAAQPVRQDIYVSAAQLAQTAYQSGAGTDTLWVRASDGILWSPWSSSFTVTAGGNSNLV